MNLESLLKELNQQNPYWPLIGIGLSVLFGYGLGKLHSLHAATTENTPPEPEPSSEEYPLKTITEAIQSKAECSIQGWVAEPLVVHNGYSGILQDPSGMVPFCLYGGNLFYYEEGIALLLLKSARTIETSITMRGQYLEEGKIFKVKHLLGRVAGKQYLLTDAFFK